MNYASKAGGDFVINVSLPLNVDSVPVQNVEANTEYPFNVNTTFEGKAYIPGLPQVQFQTSLMYLEQAPTQPAVDDSLDATADDNNVLGSVHRNIEVGESLFDGAYDQIGIQTQELDEQGTIAMIVQPRFTYVGTRAANCA